jgi:hypothetical protein
MDSGLDFIVGWTTTEHLPPKILTSAQILISAVLPPSVDLGSVATNSFARHVISPSPVCSTVLYMVSPAPPPITYHVCDAPLAWSQQCGFSFCFGGKLKGRHNNVQNVEEPFSLFQVHDDGPWAISACTVKEKTMTSPRVPLAPSS